MTRSPAAEAVPEVANPVLASPNRLKLGLFCTNAMASLTTDPALHRQPWPRSVAIARAADEMGLEAIVPIARWKGYVDDRFDHPSNRVLDPFAYAAAIAQVTSYSSIFATVHALTTHPVLAAKQSATIDVISGGRFSLNVVGGWNRREFDMFGIALREHDDRYAYLEEWLGIMRRLWTAREEFDHESDHFSLRRALSLPQPLQRDGIPIMNAALSPRGRAFAAEHAAVGLVNPQGTDPARWAEQVGQYKELARERCGRDIQVWTSMSITVRDTVEEAEEVVHRISVEQFDEVAADSIMAAMVKENGLSPDSVVYQGMRQSLRTPGIGIPVTGTPELVVEQLHAIADAGIDGVLIGYADFLGELGRLRSDVLPLMEATGLRRPHGSGE